MISPNYFRTLQIPLLQGRDFDAQDKFESQSVTIVDKGLAERYFPGQSSIGKQIKVNTTEGVKTCTIVGVVSQVRHSTPDGQQLPFQAYYPYTQFDFDGEVLVLRTPGDASRCKLAGDTIFKCARVCLRNRGIN
jgi:MacB-like periplasmic core domain